MRAMVREAAASARSQPVASVLTLLVVLGMVFAVMLTTGRTVGAEQEVLGSIDSVGTRTLIIRGEQGAGLTSSALDRIETLQGVQWAGAFSGVVDATNTAIPDGTRVPVRHVYGHQLHTLGIPEHAPLSDRVAYASPQAADLLGLADHVGSVTSTAGADHAVVGALTVPDFLTSLQPLVLIPARDGEAPVTIVVVVAASPELVGPLTAAVVPLLGAQDPTKVTVETSETLAQLRSIVQGQLGAFSRGLVLALLGLTGALVTVLLYGLVIMRRKDFGRRRALGATRTWIIGLLLTQTSLLALLGIVAGLTSSVVFLVATGDPAPGPEFAAALAILTLVTSVLAALLPAAVASRREPIRELRVP